MIGVAAQLDAIGFRIMNKRTASTQVVKMLSLKISALGQQNTIKPGTFKAQIQSLVSCSRRKIKLMFFYYFTFCY